MKKNKRSEEDLLRLIGAADVELHSARLALALAKRQVVNSETRLLDIKLHQERLEEELRVFRLAKVDYEMDARERDIARFKKVLPNILKNDKWNK